MASSIDINKRLALRFDKGTFSFDKIDLQAGPQEMYDLAAILNGFQSEPPIKVISVQTATII